MSLERVSRLVKYSLDMTVFTPTDAEIMMTGNARRATVVFNVRINARLVMIT
ncbi:hypothetical protein D3C76_1699950 [compost metagenome]